MQRKIPKIRNTKKAIAPIIEPNTQKMMPHIEIIKDAIPRSIVFTGFMLVSSLVLFKISNFKLCAFSLCSAYFYDVVDKRNLVAHKSVVNLERVYAKLKGHIRSVVCTTMALALLENEGG